MVLHKGQYIITAEHRKHLSKALKKWWSIPESRELMSKAHMGISTKGKWHQTEEAKEKIRQARLGKPHPYKRNPERGWKINEQGIKNMSEGHKCYWSTLKKKNPDRYDEIRKHMSEGQIRRHSNKKTGEKSE